MTDYTSIASRALLVSFSVSTWTGYKFDRAATTKVNDAHRATAKAGRYNKNLMAGAAEHHKLIAAAERLRDLHYKHTLPWSDENWRLLATANYFPYTDRMRKGMAELDTLKADFVAAYPDLISRAEHTHKELGLLWDPADYPKVDRVAEKFDWAIDFRGVPDRGDIRVDLPAEQLAAIEQSVTDRVEAAAREAMKDAWGRLHEAVARVAKATGPDGIVRPNLIDHVRDVVDILTRLNVSQDEGLEQLRRRVEQEIAVVQVADLREKDGSIRVNTQAKAEAIMAAMADLMGPIAQTKKCA